MFKLLKSLTDILQLISKNVGQNVVLLKNRTNIYSKSNFSNLQETNATFFLFVVHEIVFFKLFSKKCFK